MPTQFKTGKRPATYSSRDLLYSEVRPSDVYVPATQTWDLSKDFSNWGMLGNGPDNSVFSGFQGCGDCGWAGPGHEEEQAAKQAGRAIPKFSGKTIVAQYSAYSGYNPQTGANDNGSDMREVMTWRQTKGLYDDNKNVYKIGTFVQLELGNLTHLREACLLFESVGVGIEFPDSAMNQTNNGQPWTVVSGSPIDGGHYIPFVGHPGNGWWVCVTWGMRQLISYQFVLKYADEMWAYIDPERYNQVTGETYNNWKDADLEKYLTLVAQKKGLTK